MAEIYDCSSLSLHVVVDLNFTLDHYSVDEGLDEVIVCLQLSNVLAPTQTDIWADLQTRDGTALGQNFDLNKQGKLLKCAHPEIRTPL